MTTEHACGVAGDRVRGSHDTIIVKSDTLGATWLVVRLHADGRTSRAGFRADEGLSHGRRDLAMSEAAEIAARLGLLVETWPI
jgi:hypothetical protein